MMQQPQLKHLVVVGGDADDSGRRGLLTCIAAGLTHKSVPLSSAGAAAAAITTHYKSPPPASPAAGTLLRSLPLELLYDDAGLELFEAITQLPQYYLTAAESDILARHGTAILAAAGVGDGSLLVELGAGSMRKTRLLLDAVMAAGHSGVTFCALDLCERSLRRALATLQELYGSSLRLVGLVGTYEQSLAHISQPPLLNGGTACASRSSSSSSRPAASAANNAGDREAPEQRGAVAGNASPGRARIAAAAPAGDEDDSTDAACGCTAGRAIGGGSSIGRANDNGVNGSSTNGGSRLILWLGSSVGNFHRADAAAFLRKLRDTMRKGDRLLIGINRRNSRERVQQAYNDPAGLTRAFILNGLCHAASLLDAAGGGLTPCDYDYVSAVNDDAGRHEAYFAALRDTTIRLPAAAVAAALDGGHAAGDEALLLRVRAGELVHIEFSYSYSRAEVLQLAADAGLAWEQAWEDAGGEYDVHLLRRSGCLQMKNGAAGRIAAPMHAHAQR